MGAKRQANRVTWLDAGSWLRATSLGGIQRGADSVRARPWFADQPAPATELRSVGIHLPVEEAVRSRVSLRRAALHASALACVDRLPRHPGCLHAPASD